MLGNNFVSRLEDDVFAVLGGFFLACCDEGFWTGTFKIECVIEIAGLDDGLEAAATEGEGFGATGTQVVEDRPKGVILVGAGNL